MCDLVMKTGKASSRRKQMGKLRENVIVEDESNLEISSKDQYYSVLTDKIKVILNQIKAQNLNVTIHGLKSLSISNERKLMVLVKAIFEKSVNDKQNAEVYAELCVRLSSFQAVSAGNKYICFKDLLVDHCRQEVKICFSSKGGDYSQQWHEKMDAIGFWSSSSRLGFPLADVIKVKKMGTVVFVGNLFRAQLLTVETMKTVINKLFSLEGEDVWECLCSLLLIIGRDMEAKKQDLALCLRKMQEVADKRKLSESARDKLKHVIECRQNKWRQVGTLYVEHSFTLKQAAPRLSDSYEEDDAWALGTLSHVHLPRRVLRKEMRQAAAGFNEHEG